MTARYILFFSAVFLLLAAAGFWHLRADSTADSQLFRNGRFAVVAAEVSVASLQPFQNPVRKVLVKMDTASGNMWILQLSVFGSNDVLIRRASWYPVRNSFGQEY